MADAASPYKAPSKAEQNRKYLLLPLICIPIGISGYIMYGKEGAKGPSWFALHPFLMMTAFLTLSGTSLLTKKMGGADNTNLHGYLMFAASGAAGFGGYVIWTNKDLYGKPHLTTSHGQLGALALTWFLVNPWIAYVFYNPESGILRQNQLARKFHKYSGRIGIALGLISSAIGIASVEPDPIRSALLIGGLCIISPFFLL